LIVIDVPIPVRPKLLPEPSVAERLESVMGDEVLVVVEAIWKVATASVPLGTSTLVEVRLMIRQFALLAPVEHESTSPTEVTAELVVMVTELKSVDEKFSVHPAPVGEVPLALNVMFTFTLPPGEPDPPERVSDGWALATAAAASQISKNPTIRSPKNRSDLVIG
jgi:hypothetical protein